LSVFGTGGLLIPTLSSILSKDVNEPDNFPKWRIITGYFSKGKHCVSMHTYK
jgi:hypothetical protein